VEMPELTEKIDYFELSQAEKDMYEVIVEQDELTASEKIKMLRQILLHPDMLDVTPKISSSKLERLNLHLQDSFSKHNKVVVFVNDYIDDIMRGEVDILRKLNVPVDVKVRVIHGENKEDREGILKEFRTRGQRMLLMVSGRTADVGINLTEGDDVVFYNEPWTEAQRRQELARVYRPGLEKDLSSTTLIGRGTIEEGIHNYIKAKYIAVEKILRGIPITEAEKTLIERDEEDKDIDLSVGKEHAEYYMSSYELMMRIFGHVKQIGEKDFREFLKKYDSVYAQCYGALGSRSYQANANRVNATVFHEMLKGKGRAKILDLASGPEMLKRHIGDAYKGMVTSVDINAMHFKNTDGEKRVGGSMLALPFKDNSFDFLNLAFALHYLKFVPTKGDYERMQALAEMNRVLKTGGRVVVNNVHSLEFKDKSQFKEIVGMLGFRIVEDFSGGADQGDAYLSQIYTLEKISSLSSDFSLGKLINSLSSEQLRGLKFSETKTKLKDSRRIINKFSLGGKDYQIKFNKDDQVAFGEEQTTVKLGESLKQRYGSIADIPTDVVIKNGFVRLRIEKKERKRAKKKYQKKEPVYILFKTLSNGSGAVDIK
jgi:ubiquinone/menaquinone biosynthesis C-methylase UbiE